MRGLGIHKNIPVSDTKLTLGLRVGVISTRLTEDKFFSINPRQQSRASTEDESPAWTKITTELIIKPRLILIVHTDDIDDILIVHKDDKLIILLCWDGRSSYKNKTTLVQNHKFGNYYYIYDINQKVVLEFSSRDSMAHSIVSDLNEQ